MRILLVSTTAIGDTIMSTPFIRAVRQKYKEAHISVLAHHRRLEILEHNPHFNELIPYYGKGKRLIPLLWKLKRGKFDMCIVLHANDPDIVPLVRWTGAPQRVGWGESKWSHLFTQTVYRTNPPEHFMVHKKRILDSAGIPADDLQTEIFLQPEDDLGFRKHVSPWLYETGTDRFVVMHAFGTNRKKWWPLDYFFSMTEFIFQRSGRPTVFVGDNASLNIVKRHPRFNVKRHFAAFDLTIRQSAAVIQHASRMLTTDSGPMHLAFAVKCPALCLFGATRPEVHGPCFDLDLHRVIHRDPLTELIPEEVSRIWHQWVS
jgi:ADP-heptose:LPS heptosyltransferase